MVNIEVHKLARIIGGIFWETFAFSELGFDYNKAVMNSNFFKVE